MVRQEDQSNILLGIIRVKFNRTSASKPLDTAAIFRHRSIKKRSERKEKKWSEVCKVQTGVFNFKKEISSKNHLVSRYFYLIVPLFVLNSVKFFERLKTALYFILFIFASSHSFTVFAMCWSWIIFHEWRTSYPFCGMKNEWLQSKEWNNQLSGLLIKIWRKYFCLFLRYVGMLLSNILK